MDQFRAIVTGNVQGVCFRAETQAEARRLGLAGFARNLPDRSVEVVARGDRSALDRLLAFLHRGPDLARVDGVEIRWAGGEDAPDPFAIRY
jgi:acylphosphatase